MSPAKHSIIYPKISISMNEDLFEKFFSIFLFPVLEALCLGTT